MLSDDPCPEPRPVVSDAAKLCFGVAATALSAAALGALVNIFLAGWMAAAGLAVVGLLYLGMGLAELRWTYGYHDHPPNRVAPTDRVAETNSVLLKPEAQRVRAWNQQDRSAIQDSVMSDG